MKRSISNKLAAFAVLLAVFAGCKARKVLVAQTAPIVLSTKPDSSNSGTIENIKKKQVFFNTLSVKSKSSITIDKKDNNATMIIRVKKDEAIWISVTAIAGVEIARALITPDSIKMMNRQSNTYIKKPFSFINQYSAEAINFKMLQSILAGNCIEEFLSGKSTVNQQNNIQLNGTLTGLAYTVVFNANFKAIHTNLKDDGANQQLNIDYSGFQAAGGQEIPGKVTLKSISEDSITIDMEYTNIVLNEPVDMPYTVPKRFEIIN